MSNTKNDKRKNNVNLSDKNGTVSNAIVLNKEKINEICLSSASLSEAKTVVIDIIKNTSKACPSQIKLLSAINKISSKYDLLMYTYNIILAGDNLAVTA